MTAPLPMKAEKTDDLPKVKVPKIEKIDNVEPKNDPQPKLPKVDRIVDSDGPGKDLPDLKIPKLDNSGKGRDVEPTDVKDLTKRTREQVEKNDKRGKRGKSDG